MKHYQYDGKIYSGRELAELSGKNYSTLMARFERGYTVEEAICDDKRVDGSVLDFANNSCIQDWDKLTSERLHKIYWNWCEKNDYHPTSIINLMKTLKRIFPNLKIVSTKVKNETGFVYRKVVRIK